MKFMATSPYRGTGFVVIVGNLRYLSSPKEVRDSWERFDRNLKLVTRYANAAHCRVSCKKLTHLFGNEFLRIQPDSYKHIR